MDQGSTDIHVLLSVFVCSCLPCVGESLKRLGVFGFWTDPNVELENNFGLLDQRLAMQWVKAKVGSFYAMCLQTDHGRHPMTEIYSKLWWRS